MSDIKIPRNGNPGTYRTDGVDLEPTSDTAVAGTGYVLGWRTAGEWLLTVNAQAGKYAVSGRVDPLLALENSMSRSMVRQS